MLIQGNAIHVPLPDQSVHCAVTSPPYRGLRKYAGEQGEEPLGLEATPERHVERIVEICREVRRVLRDDGVFWLNYGDCYAGSWGNYGSREGGQRSKSGESIQDLDRARPSVERPAATRVNVPPGSLMMMPHRVALALQQDGWIVRQDLVWSKSNPMPESVNGWRWQRERTKTSAQRSIEQGRYEIEADLHKRAGIDEDWLAEYEYGDDLELRKGSWRHTRAHEYVFMLTKKMQYFSNQEAVREPQSDNTHSRGTKLDPPYEHAGIGHEGWTRGTAKSYIGGRNPRSVLDIPTAPYKGAHYATFPPNLIAPLIRATCPRWACPVCGQGWAPIVEQSQERLQSTDNYSKRSADEQVGWDHEKWPRTSVRSNVRGYRPTCDCPVKLANHPRDPQPLAEAVPGIVFDPFVGSGTTVAVAKSLLRQGIGIDISMEYLDHQAKVRTGDGVPSSALEDLPLFAGML